MKKPNWHRTKTCVIPAWATTIIIVTNAIDGYAPRLPEAMTVRQFIARQAELQNEEGGGEWDVLIYAADADARYGYRHPHGNQYRELRRTDGKAKKIAEWSYMRWTKHVFTRSPQSGAAMSIVRQLANCEWQGKDSLTQQLIFDARRECGWSKKDIQS